jgi:hypothetical protein
LRKIYLCKAKQKKKPKRHPPDRIFKNLKKEHYPGGDDLQFLLSQESGDVLLLPHVRQREFLSWDGQIGPVILGASIDYRLMASCYMS